MVNAKSVGKGYFKDVNEYVTEETYDEWMHRGYGYPEDVLFVTEGHTFGNTCQVPAYLTKFALGQRVITIKGHSDVINNSFLCGYMQTERFMQDINTYRTGGTAQGIRSKDLMKVQIPLPDYEQQLSFDRFCKQVDKSKVVKLFCTIKIKYSNGITIRRRLQMNSNFDYLLGNELYETFAQQAIEAEKSLTISPSTCAILSRRALELAVRFVYSYDNELELPYRDNVSTLIHERSFRDIIEPHLFPMLKYVIHLGNEAVHTNHMISRDEAVLSLRNLFEFCDWIEYSYASEYVQHFYDESILPSGNETRIKADELQNLYDKLASKDKKLEDIRKENADLLEQMTKLRQENTKNRTFSIDEISEATTRKKYIDLALKEAGWIIGVNCTIEEPVYGMPNTTGKGYVDYVLWGRNNLPLAVVEAKKASINPIVGSQQAKLYADCLQNLHNQRPLIFTTNGFEIYFTNDSEGYASRQVSGFFTQDELQLEVDRRKQRIPLENIVIKDKITNRPYQKEAIMAVCDAISKKHRKMLLVQATGSGKTRVSISIVDVLRRHNYIKNILFLADRKALVKQAKKNYVNLLDDLTCCNLLESKDDPESSRMIFSTYPTIMNAIDEKKNKNGEKLFTPGHFDLIITDEAHRSIYKKYQDIFTYFDAMVIGMTATPKDEIDKNTYGIFDLERGTPTFAYELEKAVDEGYLVNYSTLEYKTKILENGIHYKDLSEKDKEEFEEKFWTEGENQQIEDIDSSAVNKWLFNSDTLDKVLHELMDKGIKVEGGDKLGKTIIFAKNSAHAQAIVERFNRIFPEYGADYIKQIDYSIKYVDTLIDDFSDKKKMPQIAVSVDMLDTGIDIPEILNLVFFKKVRSYAKFWQMIGRGTRLCPNLLGEGIDKERFLIFDFCNNFDYFRVNKNGSETGLQESIVEKTFNIKASIIRELQAPVYTAEDSYVEYRNSLVKNMHVTVVGFNNDSFRVKRHLYYVEQFRELKTWQKLETQELADIKEHISPLVIPTDKDELARRFDYLTYSIELGLLQSKNISQPVRTVMNIADALSYKYSIPQVKEQKEIIEKVKGNEFWEKATMLDMKNVRDALRCLLQYLDKIKIAPVYTNFEDTILDVKEGEPIFGSDDLKNYRQKVEFYLKDHKDNLVVYKLRHNKRLNQSELQSLEAILWGELGTRKDYEDEYGDTPVGKLVRRIVGLDRDTVNQAFSEFLTTQSLNLNQMRFVKMIVEYIVINGNIEDNRVLTEEPFRSAGSITSIFKNDMLRAKRLMEIIGDIRKNSEEIEIA